jgi:hypothetical protein
MSFAMPQGMTLEQMIKVMGGEQPVEELAAEPEVRPRKRARDAGGRLKGDDPATPENEAWAES